MSNVNVLKRCFLMVSGDPHRMDHETQGNPATNHHNVFRWFLGCRVFYWIYHFIKFLNRQGHKHETMVISPQKSVTRILQVHFVFYSVLLQSWTIDYVSLCHLKTDEEWSVKNYLQVCFSLLEYGPIIELCHGSCTFLLIATTAGIPAQNCKFPVLNFLNLSKKSKIKCLILFKKPVKLVIVQEYIVYVVNEEKKNEN